MKRIGWMLYLHTYLSRSHQCNDVLENADCSEKGHHKPHTQFTSCLPPVPFSLLFCCLWGEEAHLKKNKKRPFSILKRKQPDMSLQSQCRRETPNQRLNINKSQPGSLHTIQHIGEVENKSRYKKNWILTFPPTNSLEQLQIHTRKKKHKY